MQLNHYLNFQGQAEAAFNFYKSGWCFKKYADYILIII